MDFDILRGDRTEQSRIGRGLLDEQLVEHRDAALEKVLVKGGDEVLREAVAHAFARRLIAHLVAKGNQMVPLGWLHGRHEFLARRDRRRLCGFELLSLPAINTLALRGFSPPLFPQQGRSLRKKTRVPRSPSDDDKKTRDLPAAGRNSLH